VYDTWKTKGWCFQRSRFSHEQKIYEQMQHLKTITRKWRSNLGLTNGYVLLVTNCSIISLDLQHFSQVGQVEISIKCLKSNGLLDVSKQALTHLVSRNICERCTKKCNR
jgi:hypothetical protein